MKRITTGDLAKAIRHFRPIVTDDMVRDWVERGLIHADRNPGNDRGWWYLMPETLEESLSGMDFKKEEVCGVLRWLGISEGTQQKIFGKKSESGFVGS